MKAGNYHSSTTFTGAHHVEKEKARFSVAQGHGAGVAGHSIQIPKWQTWAKAAQAKLESLMSESAA